MNRNVNDRFSNVPTPSLPRSKQDFGVHSRTFTCQHGKLVPFYARLVYPDSNLKMDAQAFVRADTSVAVPLQNIFMDVYFFAVPLRIIDKNFAKILGDKTFYDTNTYAFPQLELDGSMNKNSLLQYLGYGAATEVNATPSKYWCSVTGTYQYSSHPDATLGSDYVNPYSLAAYYTIYNQYFRDNNLDAEIPVDDLLVQGTPVKQSVLETISVWNGLQVLPVNKTHDIFTSGLITPINDGAQGDVTIPLGNGLVPVLPFATEHSGAKSGVSVQPKFRLTGSTNNVPSGSGLGLSGGSLVAQGSASGSPAGIYPSNLYADLSKATGASIQQLYVSMALYSLYDKRGTFGSRLIEQIRGQFGLEVPDGLLDRAEYLGGSNETLNNVPVLNTASDLGKMAGNSATLSGLNSFDKFFNEWCMVIGVCCFRTKHTYPQGIVEPSLKMFDSLDMYWPSFANIGKVGTPNYRIYNDPRQSQNKEVFNFNEPWIDQHVETDFAAGEFGAFHTPSYLTHYSQWLYQDIYASRPSFNPGWLKEPVENVARTMTNQLLPDATNTTVGHQYMVNIAFKTELTMPIPTHSHAPNITGRI